ncbi:MAG TPA: dTMP kinase [Candidatus Methylomirabilis sp.]
MGAAGARGGFFLTLEGVEGSGKSTQQTLLARRLRGAGHAVLEVREPGGTPLGESLRRLLLHTPGAAPTAPAELFLYLASRAQLAAEVIGPALAGGQVVLCDRYADSTSAYQGYGRGMDLELIARLNRLATAGVWPDLTVLLDLDPAAGLARLAGRPGAESGAAGSDGLDRFEREALAFHRRVRDGYLALARAHPDRFLVVDAAQDPATIAASLWPHVEARLCRAAPAP